MNFIQPPRGYTITGNIIHGQYDDLSEVAKAIDEAADKLNLYVFNGSFERACISAAKEAGIYIVLGSKNAMGFFQDWAELNGFSSECANIVTPGIYKYNAVTEEYCRIV